MSTKLHKLTIVFVLAGALLVSARWSFANPRGNNGTVKIDGVPFDDAPNNEPHPGCSFQVDFYGYEDGDLSASVTFEGMPPTGGGTLATDVVSIGGDPAGGGTDLDASRDFDLSAALAGIEPHERQGYHVKLTVHAEGSIGSDVKHKVFWVQSCGSGGGGGGEEPPGEEEPPSGGGPPRSDVPPAKPADPVPGNPTFTG